MAERACEKCGGSGVQRYTILPSVDPVRVIAPGVVIEDMGGSGTRACECVRDLPAIDAKCSWWDSESIYSEVVALPIYNEAVEVEAECEVPRTRDGRRCRRTAENAYYPPLVRVQAPESTTMHAEDARAWAAALVAAADACDRADALAASTMPKDDGPEIPFDDDEPPPSPVQEAKA